MEIAPLINIAALEARGKKEEEKISAALESGEKASNLQFGICIISMPCEVF